MKLYLTWYSAVLSTCFLSDCLVVFSGIIALNILHDSDGEIWCRMRVSDTEGTIAKWMPFMVGCMSCFDAFAIFVSMIYWLFSLCLYTVLCAGFFMILAFYQVALYVHDDGLRVVKDLVQEYLDDYVAAFLNAEEGFYNTSSISNYTANTSAPTLAPSHRPTHVPSPMPTHLPTYSPTHSPTRHGNTGEAMDLDFVSGALNAVGSAVGGHVRRLLGNPESVDDDWLKDVEEEESDVFTRALYDLLLRFVPYANSEVLAEYTEAMSYSKEVELMFEELYAWSMKLFLYSAAVLIAQTAILVLAYSYFLIWRYNRVKLIEGPEETAKGGGQI